MTSAEDWLEAQAGRVLARQRSRVDTAKLLATFAAGVAGALVGSALQAGPSPSAWDRIAAWALAATVALTVVVVLLDRLTEPDHARVLAEAALGAWDNDRRLFGLRRAALAASYANEDVVGTIRVALWLQLASAAFSGFAAAYSMISAP